MSPIPIPIAISMSGSTRPSLSSLFRVRSRFPARLSNGAFHEEKWVPEVFRPEELQHESLRIVKIPSETPRSDHSPRQLRPSQLQSDHIVPVQISGGNTRARGGGGSSSSGGSQTSSGSSQGSSSSPSGGFRAPVPAAVPAPQPKSPGPGSSLPGGRPVKQPLPAAPKPAPKPVSKPAPKLPAPAPKPILKPLPKLPKPAEPPRIPGNEPHNRLPHVPAVGKSGAHSSNSGSNKLGGCNLRCRNILLGTFGSLALLGLLFLLLFCIFCRRKRSKRSDVERGRRSRSRLYPDGRRWWKQGKPGSRLSEDGMELTTHTTRGIPFTMSQEKSKKHRMHDSERSTSSYDRGTPVPSEGSPMHCEELSTTLYDSEMPIHLEGTQMHNQELNINLHEGKDSSEEPQTHGQEQRASPGVVLRAQSIRSGRSSNSSPAIMTVQSISSCESCALQRAQPHNHEQSTSSSAVRKRMSIESDRSSWEAPVLGTAQTAKSLAIPKPIQMIHGFEGFRNGRIELQRRNARRNSDRPDVSHSRHQSLKRNSSSIFAIGEDSDDASGDETRTAVDDDDDDDDARTVMDDEYSRGRTSQRISHGSARKRRAEPLNQSSKEKVLKHADSGLGGSEIDADNGRGEGSPQSILAVDFLSRESIEAMHHRISGCWEAKVDPLSPERIEAVDCQVPGGWGPY